jgi:hypothetical protein
MFCLMICLLKMTTFHGKLLNNPQKNTPRLERNRIGDEVGFLHALRMADHLLRPNETHFFLMGELRGKFFNHPDSFKST